MSSQRSLLKSLFEAAVKAASPSTFLEHFFPPPPKHGNIIILAAGRVAASMVAAAEHYYVDVLGMAPKRLLGLGVTLDASGPETHYVDIVPAGHPVPDIAGLAATEKVLLLAEGASAEDLVLVLLSGGASGFWVAPIEGISLNEKREVLRSLLRSGAGIASINVVRTHLSRIKGGRLAKLAFPAELVTLAMSDTPTGWERTIFGGGATLPDPTTLADARGIMARYGIKTTPTVAAALADEANESPKPGDSIFQRSRFEEVFRPSDAFHAAMKVAEANGYKAVFLGDEITGEAREVAEGHARVALAALHKGEKVALLSGGELTVTIRGRGRGAPNQEYALALAIALNGASGISALSAYTDGADSRSGLPQEPAGAFIDGETLTRASRRGTNAVAALNDNDSTSFFETLHDLLITGPTHTNVNDFRAILVDPSYESDLWDRFQLSWRRPQEDEDM